MVHSFLLIGQSNAAGRGLLSEAEPLDTCKGRLKVFRNGRWQKMFRPLNPDRKFSGTCLAESFAKAYAESNPDVDVGIIPCADGGTEISQWAPGELLFDYAVSCAKLAMRTSSLRGILWHQGESDCGDEGKRLLYQARLIEMMNALRTALGREDVPILIGGLGDFLKDCVSYPSIRTGYAFVNQILQETAEAYPQCSFVSAEGLSANPDNLHFSSNGLKEFGLRYYREYASLHYTTENTEEIETDTARSSMELL